MRVYRRADDVSDVKHSSGTRNCRNLVIEDSDSVLWLPTVSREVLLSSLARNPAAPVAICLCDSRHFRPADGLFQRSKDHG